MKKIEHIEIEKYYCEYCDKECEHTEYAVPNFEKFPIRSGAGLPIIGYNELEKEIKPKQVDICPTCQNKIANILKDLKGER